MNRDLSVLGDIEHEWPGLKSMGIVASIRQESAVATEQDVSIRYYICSKELEAQTLLEATRSHWGVEVMHWSLDTAFCEDNSRIRADDRAEAFARIRQICLNLLKSETTFKGGIKRKRMNCAMDEKYLSKALRDGDVHAVSVQYTYFYLFKCEKVFTLKLMY
ncbi:ISAs1 family transposase [Vibrio paracholerae]|uniref:ISAs1 family transposase n=1 Tax=Vibrio TaxID=662 RepID=UPI002045C678|nr:transposase [Vibrio cholerae]BCN21415.1 putative transposase [Vibrio cholerae]GHY89765.1 putative transposase [Vibrio cholerae]